MKNQIYHLAKQRIDESADECKAVAPNDKPYRREILNNLLDELTRHINFEVLQERLTRKRADLYINWLTNYTIRRHNA